MLLYFVVFYFVVVAIAGVPSPINKTNSSKTQSSIGLDNFNEVTAIHKSTNMIFSDSGSSVVDTIKSLNTSAVLANAIESAPIDQEQVHKRLVTKTGEISNVPPLPDELPLISALQNQSNATNATSATSAPTVQLLNTHTNATGLNIIKTMTLNTTNLKLPTNSSAIITTTTKSVITTSTMPPPKKPTITQSVEDVPELKSQLVKMPNPSPEVDTLNEPRPLESSEKHTDGRQYIVPMVGIILAIPFLIIIANVVTRRLRDLWSKRNYRRMDYLIEEMYN